MSRVSSTVCGHITSMVVEPTFLARVSSATFDQPDAEMQKLVRRAKGTHALFHVRSRHGVGVGACIM